MRRMSVAYEKIAALGIVLPEVTPPVAAYVPFVRSGHLVSMSGMRIAQGKRQALGWTAWPQRVSRSEQGIRAARGVAIDLLATLNHGRRGNPEQNQANRQKVDGVLVNSAPTFTMSNILWPTGRRTCSPRFLARISGRQCPQRFHGVAQTPFQGPVWKST